ncbi:MAG: hypothetical protein CVT94_16570 [Bacteroidetes bacterium HGW-Bacteroidetes-11]|jgi:hypothetical protein|nr:MAG: hypothetical protein CVT94_16570 [Bacteroidetes bacterium HGW-Bacteroidetes-11]
MTKPLMLDQVAIRDLDKCGLLPILSKSGIECCSTPLAFESPDHFKTYKRLFDSGGNPLRELVFDEKSHSVLKFIYSKYGENERITYYDAAAISMASFGGYVMIATEPVIYNIATELNINVWGYQTLLSALVEKQILHLLDATALAEQLLFQVNNAAIIHDIGYSDVSIKSPHAGTKHLRRIGRIIQNMPGHKVI